MCLTPRQVNQLYCYKILVERGIAWVYLTVSLRLTLCSSHKPSIYLNQKQIKMSWGSRQEENWRAPWGFFHQDRHRAPPGRKKNQTKKPPPPFLVLLLKRYVTVLSHSLANYAEQCEISEERIYLHNSLHIPNICKMDMYMSLLFVCFVLLIMLSCE